MSDWIREPLHAAWAQSLKVGRLFYDSETDHQRIRVFENDTFGRVLTLDDVVQTTERDNFIYHEMMAHVPILAHGSARRALIIGGGDGGMAREVLKHASIDHITMVEFVRETAGGYDVIIVDSTDPIGPGEVLFTDTFYGHAKRALAPSGILVTQNGVPFMQGEELTNTMRAFKALFSDWTCYTATIPTYAGGPMAFGWGTDGDARRTPLAELEQRFEAARIETGYYTPAVHVAAFALPRYVERLLR